ncbi:cell division protein ZipA [Ferrimonas pelagia]
MRIVFIVVGLLAIVGLCVHGFWSLRRNTPARNRRTKVTRNKPRMAKIDTSDVALDEGVIGPARTIEPVPTAGVERSQPTPLVTPPAAPVQPSLLDEDLPVAPASSKPRAVRSRASRQEPTLGSEQIELGLDPSEPLEFEVREQPTAEPHPQPQPQPQRQPQASESALGARVDEAAPRVEIEPWREPELGGKSLIAEAPLHDVPHTEALAQNQAPEPVDHQPVDVLVLHVVGRNGPILGEELLPSLTTMGFKFGEMDIFHRHQHTAGTGPVLFSLASMVKPGTFDLDRMEQFRTEGLALFMTLPTHTDARVGFSIMLGSAQGLADLHDAEILDEQRAPWTDAAEANYLARIKAAETEPA